MKQLTRISIIFKDICMRNSKRIYSSKSGRYKRIMEQINCRKEPKKLDLYQKPFDALKCKAIAVEENPSDWVKSSYSQLPVISGVPCNLRRDRVAFIRKRSKHAMQSGTHNIHVWLLSYGHQGTWENFLMGWKSTGDPLSPIELAFETQEEAIQHCDRYGWDYEIEGERPKKVFKPKSYGENYSFNKRTRVSTK